jgi:hypothetical protein
LFWLESTSRISSCAMTSQRPSKSEVRNLASLPRCDVVAVAVFVCRVTRMHRWSDGRPRVTRRELERANLKYRDDVAATCRCEQRTLAVSTGRLATRHSTRVICDFSLLFPSPAPSYTHIGSIIAGNDFIARHRTLLAGTTGTSEHSHPYSLTAAIKGLGILWP